MDHHESCGEGTGKQVARHVRVLTQEERIKDEWSSPTVLPLIEYSVNSHVSSETGIVPLEATFGSQDAIYLTMPDSLDPRERAHEFVRRLEDNLRLQYLKSFKISWCMNVLIRHLLKSRINTKQEILFYLNATSQYQDPTNFLWIFSDLLKCSARVKNDVTTTRNQSDLWLYT